MTTEGGRVRKNEKNKLSKEQWPATHVRRKMARIYDNSAVDGEKLMVERIYKSGVSLEYIRNVAYVNLILSITRQHRRQHAGTIWSTETIKFWP